jgi:autotransporter-associated beta strand protein
VIPSPRVGRYVGHSPSTSTSGVWTLKSHQQRVSAGLWGAGEIVITFDGSGSGVINLGSGSVDGKLVYSGAGTTTARVVNLAGISGGGTIESNGTGAIVFSQNLTVNGSVAKTFTLAGSNTNTNSIASIPASPVSLVKSGAGTWRLGSGSYYTGETTIKNGTVIVGVDTGWTTGSADPFGAFGAGAYAYPYPILGDDSAGATGEARMLFEDGVRFDGRVRVPALGAGATQAVVVGGANSTGTSEFPKQNASSQYNFIQTDREISIVATTGGTFEIGAGLNNLAGDSYPDVDINFGGSGYGGKVIATGGLSTGQKINILSGIVEVSNSTAGVYGTAGVYVNGGELRWNRTSYSFAGTQLYVTSGVVSGIGDYECDAAIVFGSNAIVSPGDPIGDHDFICGVEFAAGGTMRWHVADWNGTGSQLQASGGLSVTATTGSKFTIEIVGITGDSYPITEGAVANFTNASSKSFTIATSSGLTGFAANKFAIDDSRFANNNSLAGGSWSLSQSGNDIVLTFTNA